MGSYCNFLFHVFFLSFVFLHRFTIATPYTEADFLSFIDIRVNKSAQLPEASCYSTPSALYTASSALW